MEKWNVTFKSTDTTTAAQDDTKQCSQSDNEGKLIKDFSSYTTLHGFHFILDSGSLWRRVLWMSLIVGGFVFLVLQIWISLQRLFAKEVVISKSIEVAKALQFPAVTICNQNMMKKSKILGTVAQDYLDQMDDIKFRFAGQKQKDVPSFDVEDTLKKAGHQINEMVQYCTFAGVQFSVTEEFTPTMSSFPVS